MSWKDIVVTDPGENLRPTPGCDWLDIKRRVIAGLGPDGVLREFAALGVRIEGGYNSKGKATCHAMNRPDKQPSAFLNVRDAIYHSSGDGSETLNLFDFALKYGGPAYGDWLSTMKHYAKIAGVEVNGRRDSKGRVLEACYDYQDAAGTLLYQVIRYKLANGKKDFRQRRPDGQGGWIYDLEGVERVLYGLPQIMANPSHHVLIVEGEKDADRLNERLHVEGVPMVATTSAQGAGDTGRWLNYAESLRGRTCIIIPDNDPPGMRHAQSVCGFLHQIASSVKLIELPGIGPKGDVSDWLDQGNGLDDLWSLIVGASSWEPSQAVSLGSPRNVPIGQRVQIEITTNENQVVQMATLALGAAQNLYQRSNMLVEIQRATAAAGSSKELVARPEGSIRILPILQSSLRRISSEHIDWIVCKADKKRGKSEFVSAHAPAWVIDQLHSLRYWPGFSHLEGVLECPTIRPDGSLLLSPGYDRQTGLWLAYSGDPLDVDDHPSRARCQLAYQELANLVEDFPFAGEPNLAAWVASLLSVIGRPAIQGPCPLFLFDANVAAAGKSLLADLVAVIVTGRNMPRASYPDREEEMEKVLLSILMSGDRHVLFDNVASGGRIGGKALDSALTARTMKGRILGRSEWTPELSLDCVFFATGNNLGVRGDAVRRIIPCRLESPLERPEERSGFVHDDILSYAGNVRASLLTSSLTILRGYYSSGKPQQNIDPMGSYEEWSGLVRSAIMWVSGQDACGPRKAMAADDDERNDLVLLLRGWAKLCDMTGRGVTSNEVVDLMEMHPCEEVNAAKAVILSWSQDDKKPSARIIGNRLRPVCGRVIEGMRLKFRHQRNGRVWSVV
jgi:hypothetical protein